jgi:hypothetical protein
MAEKKVYNKTSVIVWGKDYDEATLKYSSEVVTKFYKTLPFTLEVFAEPKVKEGDWGKGTIIGEVSIAGKQIGIRERDSDYGKSYQGTIIKSEFFINLEQVLSRGETTSYEVKFVERDYGDVSADPEADADQPF